MKQNDWVIVGVLGALALLVWKKAQAGRRDGLPTDQTPFQDINPDMGGQDFGVTNPGSWD